MEQAAKKQSKPAFAEVIDALRIEASKLNENSDLIRKRLSYIKGQKPPCDNPDLKKEPAYGVLGELCECAELLRNINCELENSNKMLIELVGE